MVEPLTDAWIEAMDVAASTHDGLRKATTEVVLVLEYRVVDGATWHVRMERGTVGVIAGPADEPDLRFTTDSSTATAMAMTCSWKMGTPRVRARMGSRFRWG